MSPAIAVFLSAIVSVATTTPEPGAPMGVGQHASGVVSAPPSSTRPALAPCDGGFGAPSPAGAAELVDVASDLDSDLDSDLEGDLENDVESDDWFFSSWFPTSFGDLHPAVGDRAIMLYAALVLFPEALPALWAPSAVTGLEPESYLSDVWPGLLAHLALVVLCPPALVVDVPWLLPVFVIKTFDDSVRKGERKLRAPLPALRRRTGQDVRVAMRY